MLLCVSHTVSKYAVPQKAEPEARLGCHVCIGECKAGKQTREGGKSQEKESFIELATSVCGGLLIACSCFRVLREASELLHLRALHTGKEEQRLELPAPVFHYSKFLLLGPQLPHTASLCSQWVQSSPQYLKPQLGVRQGVLAMDGAGEGEALLVVTLSPGRVGHGGQ